MSTATSLSFLRNRAHHVRLACIFLFLMTLAQLIYNVILVVHFETSMAVFQASWVHFSIIALVSLFAVIIFGFYAVSSHTDRQASILKSWVLFFGSTLFFCGFFHVISYVRDDFLFYSQCSRGFHGPKENHDVEPDTTATHPHDFCRKLYDKLLVVWVILWLAHSASSILLLLVIRWYRKAHFSEKEICDEDVEDRGRPRDRKDTHLKTPTIVVHSAPTE